jgi:hypothetical protein
MESGRTTRTIAFALAAVLCVAAGVWLAPRVRSGGSQALTASAPVDAYRPEPGTALLEVPPPLSAAGGNIDAAWQRAVQTHAARIADPAVIGRAVGDGGPVSKTRWGAKEGTAAHAGAAAAVKRSLSVRLVPGTALIAVRVDVDPKTEAAELTNALCDAYVKRSRELSQQHTRDRTDELRKRAAVLEQAREERLHHARHFGRQFGGDPQVGREQVSAAAARLARLQESLAAARGSRAAAVPATAPADAPTAKELDALVKQATADLEKIVEAAAESKACFDAAAEMGERLARLRDEIDRADRAEEARESAIRVVQRATAQP